VVFLAERSDGSFRQRVAIKIVRRDLDPEAIERRFRAERQILAGLAHPNIARLLDGGSTPGGFPYLVMEHVDGLPIDEYCDRRRLDVRARLELFVQVCSAVQHAHRNLVIHRDLKPGNVLVTEEGVPKLLDFGVAKLLGPAGLLDPCDRTVTGERPLTPSYASPEQLTGKPVTTASDTYSLGVVLYLLLVGELPRRFSGVLPADVAEMLKEPHRPSLAVLAGGPSAAAVAERRGVSPDSSSASSAATSTTPCSRLCATIPSSAMPRWPTSERTSIVISPAGRCWHGRLRGATSPASSFAATRSPCWRARWRWRC
jgi:serine/threonine protein kinase